MEIAKGVHFLKYPFGSSWTGMILLARERVVLIDTAVDAAVEGFLYPYMEKIGLRRENIDIIINTHTHADHIGGNARLKKDTGARLAAHTLSREKLQDPYLHLNKIRKHFSQYIPFQEIKSGLTPLDPDIVLKDGDIIDLGNSTLRIIHTPGHDTDTICIHDSASGFLFSGDSLQSKGVMSAGVAFYQYLDDYRNSLKKVSKLITEGAVKAIVPAHPYSPFSGVALQEDIKRFIRLCRETVELYDKTVRDILRENPEQGNLLEITREFLNRVGLTTEPSVLALPLYTVNSHLNKILTEKSILNTETEK